MPHLSLQTWSYLETRYPRGHVTAVLDASCVGVYLRRMLGVLVAAKRFRRGLQRAHMQGSQEPGATGLPRTDCFHEPLSASVEAQLAGHKALGRLLVDTVDGSQRLLSRLTRLEALLEAHPELQQLSRCSERQLATAFALLQAERLGMNALTKADLVALMVAAGVEKPVRHPHAAEREREWDLALGRWKATRRDARRLLPVLRALEPKLRAALGLPEEGEPGPHEAKKASP